MVNVTPRNALGLLALLGLTAGGYGLVVLGAVPIGLDAGVALTGVAAVATIGAIGLRATVPAITAGVATLGLGVGVTASGFVVTVAAALAILGGVGFLVSALGLAGTRAFGASPT